MDNKHLTFKQILAFVCADSSKISKSPQKYFSYLKHFSECEKCRTIKNHLTQIETNVKNALTLLDNDEIADLKAKVAYSSEKFNLPYIKFENIIIAVKGTVSNTIDRSEIHLPNENNELLCKNFNYVISNEADGSEKTHLDRIIDNKYNTIILDAGNVSIYLSNDEKLDHTMLVIPTNGHNEPFMCKFEREDSGWKAECACPEDDYEIIVF